MMVRLYEEKDYKAVKAIHEKFYEKEFDFEELFDDKTLERILITDDNDEVLTFGGLRTLVEIVAVTNIDRTVRERRAALIRLLDAMKFIAHSYNYDALHCFPLGSEDWYNHLRDYGFKPTRGNCLSIEV